MTKQSTALEDPILKPTQEFLADPYTLFARFRAEAPVWWSEKGKYWIVTRYADAHEILGDLSYGKRLDRWRQINPFVRMLPPVAESIKQRSLWLLNQNPPDHTRLRGLVNKAFTPSIVQNLRPRIEEIAAHFIDRVADSGEMDVIADYAFPIPVTVIAEMLGVPSTDRDRFHKWSRALTENLEPSPDFGKMANARKAHDELIEYLRPLVADRRLKPKDDLISALVAAEEEGNKLTEDELLENVVLLLVAGHETTVNLIGNGILNLLRHPGELALLRQKPELMDQAVAEILRFDGPVQMVRRLAGEDLELAGQMIKEGDMVTVLLGAANRDPAEFENPDTFDITRPKRKNVAFGHGIHHCLGASLAEAEGEIALRILFNRLPEVTLKPGTLTWRHPFALRGVIALPVTF